jgi:IMP dehydrogenase
LVKLEEYFTFDDVLILPSYSTIDTRESISTDVDFLGLKLRMPIISSNMDYITGSKMAIAMYKAGGMGILHRFMPWDDQLNALEYMADEGAPIAFSVGVRDSDEALNRVATVRNSLVGPLYVTVDVAHGDHKRVIDLIPKIQELGNTKVIAGNIATGDGYKRLADAGADAIKVGIGPGSVCTTREVTGVGVPQLSAIMEVAEARESWFYYGPDIIADGGIKNSGDIVKALAAGADVVMLGSLLAGSSECPVEAIQTPDGRRLKPYRGQSIFGTNGLKFVPEGISGYVDERGPVAEIVKQLQGGLRSGMSYIGARNLAELQVHANFIRVSHNTHLESSTRIKTSF